VQPHQDDGQRSASDISDNRTQRVETDGQADAVLGSHDPGAADLDTMTFSFHESSPAPASMRRPSRTLRVSYEGAAYVALLILAILTRFWDLGSKTLHHDESLHTYYSWVYATGGGYTHDPLMHGPFLFHANALVYLLFGDTDATSRYMPAFFGVLMVGMPWLLRGPKFLGRWGALAASFFLLISPSILYQSRYIRHDIYTIAGSLFLFICVVRYLEAPRRLWLVSGFATIAFLLTNHEIIFAILAIFGGYLYGAWLVETVRSWRRFAGWMAWVLVGAHAALVAGLAALYLIVPASRREELLDIPWNNPTPAQERDYYQTVFSNPLVIGAIVLVALFVAALVVLILAAREEQRRHREAGEALPGPGLVQRAIRAAWTDKTGLLAAMAAFLAVFVPLYTSLFQNMDGLRSATIATDGTLLYWLGQHDFQRGEQPWFYFLVLMPQYEFIAFLFGGFMVAVVGFQLVRAIAGRVDELLFFRLFLALWFVLIFAGLSYAGEKMPWLVVHITLPGVLLAASFMGPVLERIVGWARGHVVGREMPWSSREWLPVGLILACAGTWFWYAAPITYGEFVPEPMGNRGGWRRTVAEAGADNWWRLSLPVLVGIAVVALWIVMRGARRTALALALATTIGFSMLQVHVGWHLSYQVPDVPRDMLIYTQTSPDVSRIMNEVDELSAQLTGGNGLVVWYDSHVSWPFQWYLRNYPNKRFIGSALSGQPENAAIVLVGGTTQGDAFLAGYAEQEYVLRWWFPEEMYRDFAIAPEINPGRSAWKTADQPHGPVDILRSIGESVANQKNPADQARLYRLVMYRDLDAAIGQTTFKIYIREDLLPLYDAIRYGS
jgi:uncharacterized protein (TIGR03663 family)